MRTCTVTACNRVHYAQSYCNAHWRRWKRNGDPGPTQIGPHGTKYNACSAEGCERNVSARGLCGTHYARLMRGIDHACCPGFKSCGKCVRALLCGNCNAGLGVFKEDIRSLEAAVQYLLKHTS